MDEPARMPARAPKDGCAPGDGALRNGPVGGGWIKHCLVPLVHDLRDAVANIQGVLESIRLAILNSKAA